MEEYLLSRERKVDAMVVERVLDRRDNLVLGDKSCSRLGGAVHHQTRMLMLKDS